MKRRSIKQNDDDDDDDDDDDGDDVPSMWYAVCASIHHILIPSRDINDCQQNVEA